MPNPVVQMATSGVDPGLNNEFEVYSNIRLPRGNTQASSITIPSEGKVSITEYKPGNRTTSTKRTGGIEYANIEIEVAYGCGYELSQWAREVRRFVLSATQGLQALRSPRPTALPASFRDTIKIIASDSGRPLKEYTLFDAWPCDTKPKSLTGTNSPEPWSVTYEICFERMDSVDLYMPTVVPQVNSIPA